MQDIGSTGVPPDENRKAILEQAKRSLADFLSARSRQRAVIVWPAQARSADA